MEIYIKLFEVLFPVFFVIGIGYYLGKKDKKFSLFLQLSYKNWSSWNSNHPQDSNFSLPWAHIHLHRHRQLIFHFHCESPTFFDPNKFFLPNLWHDNKFDHCKIHNVHRKFDNHQKRQEDLQAKKFKPTIIMTKKFKCYANILGTYDVEK